LTYCLYDPRHNCFRTISHGTAEAIVEGRLQVDFEASTETRRLAKLELRTQVRAHLLNHPRVFQILQALRGRKVRLEQLHQLRQATGEPSMTFRRIGREYLIMNARLYQAFQRLRGRSFSLDQIAQIRAEEARGRIEVVQQPMIKLADVTVGDLPLGPGTVIISGGLDWEYKNVRGIYKIKKAHGFRYAAILYDLIPLNLPQYVVPHYVNVLADYFGELFWMADFAMCISRKTQEDVLEYCAKNGMTPPATDHFPLGGDLPPADADAAPPVLPEALAGKRYAIFVSTIEPRKNHRTLYEAWNHAIVQGQVDPESCRLVFVGRPGWNTGELMHEIRSNPYTKDTIVILEGISDALLNALYEGAEFGLFPSRYEGYGLPLAEMLSHGLPCIVSPAGSLPEVGGSLVVYKDPVDIMGWSEEISRFFAEPELLATYREAIRDRYQPVSWEGAAEAFFKRLEVLVNS
jgi:glycosyltransferase involved in cell wall biosynthesis